MDTNGQACRLLHQSSNIKIFISVGRKLQISVEFSKEGFRVDIKSQLDAFLLDGNVQDFFPSSLHYLNTIIKHDLIFIKVGQTGLTNILR